MKITHATTNFFKATYDDDDGEAEANRLFLSL